MGHEVRLNHRTTIIWHTEGMPDEDELWVGEADQARPPQIPRELEHARIDFLIMEISALRDQLARMPTRGYIARAALGIIFSTAVFTTLFNWWLIAH